MYSPMTIIILTIAMIMMKYILVCLGDNWRGPYKDVQEDGPRQQWQNLKAGELDFNVLTNFDQFQPTLTENGQQ